MPDPNSASRFSPVARVATVDDLPGIGRTIAAAFADDPVWRHLVPRRDQWDRGAARLFQADADNRLRHGHVYTVDGCLAAAVWSPPGRWKTAPVAFIREVLPALRLFGRQTFTTLKTLRSIEQHHPPDPPHWYLASLGTEPKSQGKGLGSALLQPVLERCDTEGLPAYLESSKEQNLAFYARHGFEPSEPLDLPNGGPPVWPMWRAPR